MPETNAPIRIRITRRDSPLGDADPRDVFWRPLREFSDESNASIASFEGRFVRRFGPSLRDGLVDSLARAARATDERADPLVRDFERLLLKFGPRREYGYQFTDAFATLIEERSRLLRESPGIRDARERMSLAATLVFSTRITGYSSLEAELSVGSLQKLARIFDGNFESFRVFLEAFVPVAFANVFNDQFADVHEYSVHVPAGFASGFNAAVRAEARPVSAAVVSSEKEHSGQSTSRERAEWLWRLANGSLLVPFLLALAVMWFGLQALSGIYRDHRDAMTPVLEHQLMLLQEDRERLVGMTQAMAVEPGTIDYATYTGAGDPNLRSEVIVNGAHLKSSGAKDTGDCETRMPHHPDPRQRAWVECREVKNRSGTMYHVVVEHGAAFDHVEIRVRGENGNWSNAAQVQK